MSIKTADELARDWSSIKGQRIPKSEKVPRVKAIREGIRQIELAAVRDMGYPFSEVQKARDLLEPVDKWLEAA